MLSDGHSRERCKDKTHELPNIRVEYTLFFIVVVFLVSVQEKTAGHNF